MKRNAVLQMKNVFLDNIASNSSISLYNFNSWILLRKNTPESNGVRIINKDNTEVRNLNKVN